MSTPVVKTSVEASLLDHDIFADDEAVRSHLLKPRHHAADMLVGIDKAHNYREIATSFHEVCRVDCAAAEKSCYHMEGYCAEHVFLAQKLQNFQMQRAMAPGIAFGEIHGDLHGHGSSHSTILAPAQRRQARRRGTV